jgi:hypothetical protein
MAVSNIVIQEAAKGLSKNIGRLAGDTLAAKFQENENFLTNPGYDKPTNFSKLAGVAAGGLGMTVGTSLGQKLSQMLGLNETSTSSSIEYGCGIMLSTYGGNRGELYARRAQYEVTKKAEKPLTFMWNAVTTTIDTINAPFDALVNLAHEAVKEKKTRGMRLTGGPIVEDVD